MRTFCLDRSLRILSARHTPRVRGGARGAGVVLLEADEKRGKSERG